MLTKQLTTEKWQLESDRTELFDHTMTLTSKINSFYWLDAKFFNVKFVQVLHLFPCYYIKKAGTPNRKTNELSANITSFQFHCIAQQLSFYPRDAMLARVIGTATCMSVHLSVTRRYCVKTKKASGMISSPSGSPKIVF